MTIHDRRFASRTTRAPTNAGERMNNNEATGI
jgi:hypothetical protein